MKMKILTAAVIAACALPVFAQTSSTPRIDQRQAEQQQSINQGVRSGNITPKEEAHLRKYQAKIRKMERQAMADGRMSRTEKLKIEAVQARESARIAKQTHNLHKTN